MEGVVNERGGGREVVWIVCKGCFSLFSLRIVGAKLGNNANSFVQVSILIIILS